MNSDFSRRCRCAVFIAVAALFLSLQSALVFAVSFAGSARIRSGQARIASTRTVSPRSVNLKLLGPAMSMAKPFARSAGVGAQTGAPALGPLPAPEVAATVEKLAAAVESIYFDPTVASRVAASLRGRLSSDAYANAATDQELAQLLTRDMFAWTHDKHLAAAIITKDAPPPADGGVHKPEILSGNVGYLEITGFSKTDEARAALSGAMKSLRKVDALILDLRANLGGSPDMTALVASYMLEKRGLPLFDIIPESGAAQRYATSAGELPGRDGRRPIYVLTSAATFSAGEGLAFLLQEQKRAIVIGETTAGAANPGRDYYFTERLKAFIPNGRVVSAVRRGNWEGTGVAPDKSVPAADALRVAQELDRASRGLLERKVSSSPAWRDLVEQQDEP